MKIETILNSIFSLIATTVTCFIGSMDTLFITVIVFMIIDYITGVVKHFSPEYKKKDGISSARGLWGFIKKFLYILVIVIGYRIDILMNIDILRNAICYFFIANEGISILENLTEMGVPFPNIVTKYLEVIQEKVNGKEK